MFSAYENIFTTKIKRITVVALLYTVAWIYHGARFKAKFHPNPKLAVCFIKQSMHGHTYVYY